MGHNCFSQKNTLTSKVVDSDTKEPLPYVNIIIKDKRTGTFSDENGAFQIEYLPGDSLIVSHVGYERVTFLIDDIGGVVELTAVPTILSEVTVNPSKKTKKGTLGIDKKKIETYMGGVLQYAMLVENQEDQIGFIKRLHFEVGHSVDRGKENKREARIRIRVYEKDPITGKPGANILKKEKIVAIKPNQKDVHIDISEENISFPLEGLFVGIDILGFVDESGKLINYHISEAKKHVRIPLTTSITKPLTYVNPKGQKWVVCKTLNSKTGKVGVANACFEIAVEF